MLKRISPRNPYPHTFTSLVRARLNPVSPNDFRAACLRTLGLDDGILVQNGREGFYLALSTLTRTGDEVVMPALTCNVLVGPLLKTGVTPVFADVSRTTLNMELEHVLERLTPKTRAVVLTHQFGFPADSQRIVALCRSKGIAVIEDAAPAFGNRDQDKFLGTFGDLGFFSFERSKVISSCEGGLLVGRPELLKAIRKRFSERGPSRSYFLEACAHRLLLKPNLYGATLAAWKKWKGKESSAEDWHSDVETYGEHYSGIAGFQAALGMEQLARLDGILSTRKKAAAEIRKTISDSRTPIELPQTPRPGMESTYSRLPILVDDKNGFRGAALAEGLDLGFTFSYKMPSYFSSPQPAVPNTDSITSRILNIPIGPSERENQEILEKLRSTLIRWMSGESQNRKTSPLRMGSGARVWP